MVGIDEPLFTFDHVTVEGRHGSMLVDVDGFLPSSGITMISGPSGSGKSTLLRLCNRLVAPTSGRVRFRGEDMTRLDPLRLRRRVGMVFQRPTPFPGTVRDNLRVASSALEEATALDALARADLDPGFLDKPANELSAGESQRACLARTLVTEPEVLLMDEPTSALDGTSAAVIEGLARGLACNGVPVVWVSHDREQVRRLADHVIMLVQGCIEHAGEGLDDR